MSTKEDRQTKRWIAGAVLCFVLFLLLTAVVWTGHTRALDTALAQRFYSLRSDGLTVCAKALTALGNWYSIVAICAVLLAVPATRRDWGIPVTLVALVTNVLRVIVKLIVARPRPDRIFHLIEESSTSYPSGHAVTSIAVYGLLAYLLMHQSFRGHTALGVLCAFLAVIIGITRIYLGVHYPCDVLGGWLIGLGLLFLMGAWQAHGRKAGGST